MIKYIRLKLKVDTELIFLNCMFADRSRRTRRKDRSVSTHRDSDKRDRKTEKRSKHRSVSKRRESDQSSRLLP